MGEEPGQSLAVQHSISKGSPMLKVLTVPPSRPKKGSWRMLALGAVEVDVVNRRAIDLAADAFQCLEQKRRIRMVQSHAFRCIEAHPERTRSGPEQAEREQQ